MALERTLRLIAGAFVILSVLLGMYVDTRFLWFTLFVGLNLFQSAFSNWCPMMAILRKAGVPEMPAGWVRGKTPGAPAAASSTASRSSS